jgi:hypothetical protein
MSNGQKLSAAPEASHEQEEKDPDIQKVLADNLKITVSQVERYLLIGLGACIFVFALAFTARGKSGELPIDLHSEYLPGPVSVSTARVFALIAYYATALMASLYLARAQRIIALLQGGSRRLLDATLTYPSIPTVRVPGVRLGIALVPAGLLAGAAYLINFWPTTDWRATVWVLFAVPSLTLVSYLYRPLGDYGLDGGGD